MNDEHNLYSRAEQFFQSLSRNPRASASLRELAAREEQVYERRRKELEESKEPAVAQVSNDTKQT